jgi:hypothetical protein
MAIFVCGDTHCPIDIKKLTTKEWPDQKELTKEDILIILGDCGLLWASNWDKEELYWAKWLTSKRFLTCFIDGNHENFDRINKLPIIPFHGGLAGIAYEDNNGIILHLKRGEVYNISGSTIFTFGGAQSTDKEHRIFGLSWWPEEVPNYAECDHAIENLEKVNFKVDYILTHTAPTSIITDFSFINASKRIDDPTSRFLEDVLKRTEFKQWHFGHFHTTQHKDMKFLCHYNWSPFELL